MTAKVLEFPKKEKEAENVTIEHDTKPETIPKPAPPRGLTMAEAAGTIIDDGSY